jgi:hypothetical protein
MSLIKQQLNSIKSITDTDLSKILGLTVDIELINNPEKITGMIYSLLKQNNFLIRKIFI